MPIVNIDLGWLSKLLGKPYDPEVLRESLEQIGCDVEDVDDIKRSRCPQCNSLVEHPFGQDEVKACTICSFESETPFKQAGSQKVMRLDLLADRPDLFVSTPGGGPGATVDLNASLCKCLKAPA